MKIGITIGIANAARPNVVKIIAEHADRLGFGTLWAPEHVVLFDRYTDSKYPYSDDGQFALPGSADWMDPFITLSFAAAHTKQIRLATGICLVPEHNPLVLAKVIASLDFLSSGRFALGVGIGWSAEEFAALGVPFERRAARTREYINVMRQLWSEEKTTYAGEVVNFHDARSFPKPPQGSNLPIIFGGESAPALRRVAEYGTGWYGFNLNPTEAAAKIERLHTLVREQGRDPKAIDIIVSPYTKRITPDDLKGYHEAGVREVVIFFSIPKNDEEIPARLEETARQWVAPADSLG
jgi:probable F420-dependent oxidoreductase